MKTLIQDILPVKLSIEEGVDKNLYLKGRFGITNKPTSNGRMYKDSLMERELKKLVGGIKEGKVYGELDHPGDGKTKLQRVSHLITDLKLEGDGSVIGALKVLRTTNGQNLKAIVEGGGSVGISTRGFGSVTADESGNQIVGDDYDLITFDVVVDPATETAYPKAFYESKESLPDDASRVTIKDIKERYPKVYDEIKDEFSKDIEVVMEEKVETQKNMLMSKFAQELISKSSMIENNVRDRVKKELVEEAVGKVTEKIMVEGEDRSKEIEDLKKKIEEKEIENRILSEKIEKVKNLIEKIELEYKREVKKAEKFIKEVSHKLYVEKKLDECFDDKARKFVKRNISDEDSFKEIDKKVNRYYERAEERGLVTEGNLKREISKLTDENKELKEEIKGFEKKIKDLEYEIEVAKKTEDRFDKYKVRKVAAQLKDKNSLDSILESFNEEMVPEEYKKIRNIGRGAGKEFIEEDGKKLLNDAGEVLGVSIKELRVLSGITKEDQK